VMLAATVSMNTRFPLEVGDRVLALWMNRLYLRIDEDLDVAGQGWKNVEGWKGWMMVLGWWDGEGWLKV
jgi:hypothetical protein